MLDDPLVGGADAQHVEGPREPSNELQEPAQVVDTYGFTLTITPEQAAILDRCRAKQEAVRSKWVEQAQEAGLPPTDALKKLCRKVRVLPPRVPGNGDTASSHHLAGTRSSRCSLCCMTLQCSISCGAGCAAVNPVLRTVWCVAGCAARHAASGVAGAFRGGASAPEAAASLLRRCSAAGRQLAVCTPD